MAIPFTCIFLGYVCRPVIQELWKQYRTKDQRKVNERLTDQLTRAHKLNSKLQTEVQMQIAELDIKVLKMVEQVQCVQCQVGQMKETMELWEAKILKGIEGMIRETAVGRELNGSVVTQCSSSSLEDEEGWEKSLICCYDDNESEASENSLVHTVE